MIYDKVWYFGEFYKMVGFLGILEAISCKISFSNVNCTWNLSVFLIRKP